jgi:hypothetical protein
MTAILPCNDLDACESFYALLGFSKRGDHGDYRILRDDSGASPAPQQGASRLADPGSQPLRAVPLQRAR